MIITPDLRPCKAASDWLCYLVMNYERVTLLEDRGRPEPQSRSQTSALTACFPRRFLDTELCIDVLQTAERCVTTRHTPCGASSLPARALESKRSVPRGRPRELSFPSTRHPAAPVVSELVSQESVRNGDRSSVRADFAGSHWPAPLPSGASIWRSRYPSPHTAHR